MSYTAQITRANPTLIVFLLDQSGSMADPFGGEGSGRKADFVANAVNHALHDLVIRCTKTEEVRDYYHVAVVGYDNNQAAWDSPIPLTTIAQPGHEVGDVVRRLMKEAPEQVRPYGA